MLFFRYLIYLFNSACFSFLTCVGQTIHKSNWLKYFTKLYTKKTPSGDTAQEFFASCLDSLNNEKTKEVLLVVLVLVLALFSINFLLQEPKFAGDVRHLVRTFQEISSPAERKGYFLDQWLKKTPHYVVPILIVLTMGSKQENGDEGKRKEKEPVRRTFLLDCLSLDRLQFDMRGLSETLGDTQLVSAGEMKCGDPKKAVQQLRLFLSTKAMVVYLHSLTSQSVVKNVKAFGLCVSPLASEFHGQENKQIYGQIIQGVCGELTVFYSFKPLCLQ